MSTYNICFYTEKIEKKKKKKQQKKENCKNMIK